ncbi:MAG: 2-oxoacid:acceptor oxidoreductase family protein [Candidatus Aenigmarchaeota archaeon]|nr:2-oxoacid:acceptor oxidoreductase family protein [Candidatus Aenigmarchaeota archaeon]
MYTFRIHGRGGQGVEIASRVVDRACFLSGFYVQDFTFWKQEPRIAPITSYVKTDKKPILSKDLTEPDFLLVMDKTLLGDIKDVRAGAVLFNAPERFGGIKKKDVKNYYVNATDIGLSTLLKPIPNTAMLGGLCKIFTKISLRAMKRAAEIEIRQNQKENLAAMDEGFKKVKRM